jgi:hypothetical protein
LLDTCADVIVGTEPRNPLHQTPRGGQQEEEEEEEKEAEGEVEEKEDEEG